MPKSLIMQTKKHNQKPRNNSEQVVIDFGTRKISNQNFSKMIAIPKDALRNCGNGKAMSVNVKLVQQNGERFIKLIPICEAKEKRK